MGARIRKTAWTAGVLAGFLFPGRVWAETALPGMEAPDLFMAGVKMAGALAVLIGGLLLALYLVKRLGAARSGLFGGQELIRIIGTRALAPKKYIALVEVGGSVLTLGVTNEGISCLDKVPAAAFHENSEKTIGADHRGGFARRLKSLTQNKPTAQGDQS